jgi:hypothetical protein
MSIIKSARRMWYQFRVIFFGRLLRLNRNLVTKCSIMFIDGTLTFNMYRSEKFTSLITFSPETPSIVMGARPYFDRDSAAGVAFYCNKAFMQMSDASKLAFCFHEVGHLVNDHFAAKGKRICGVIDDTQFEIEADRFACVNGHGQALYDCLFAICNSVRFSTDKSEVMDLMGDDGLRIILERFDARLAAIKEHLANIDTDISEE